jgi:hypothetical protein
MILCTLTRVAHTIVAHTIVSQTIVSQPTEPIYAHSLRHIPEKLRQERVLQEVKNRLEQVTQQILQDAVHQTETNFTLFCNEPNHYPSLFEDNGNKYSLPELGKRPNSRRPIYPKPKCSLKDGYELYRRSKMDYHTTIDPKQYPPLDYDKPIVSIEMFFQYFNQRFPDLRLTIVHKHMVKVDIYHGQSEPIFDTDCCPIYTVSWKE